MEIDISNELSKNVGIAARKMGLSEEEVVARAVMIYLKNLKEYADLQREIDGWEEAGTEDADNFFRVNNL